MAVECTASAEPESYRTPRSCLRAVRQRLDAWRGLREQRRAVAPLDRVLRIVAQFRYKLRRFNSPPRATYLLSSVLGSL